MSNWITSRMWRSVGTVLCVLVWLANANNPPTGRTGAPFDNGSCNSCHEGGNFSGLVSIQGLPSFIEPSTTYPLEVTLTPTGGNPSRGGFQLVVVDGNSQNAGDLIAINAQSGTEFFNGREYLEQRQPKLFTGGGPVSWSFNWKSPLTAARDTIRFFFIGNFCNGNGSSSGDIAFPATLALRLRSDTTSTTAEQHSPFTPRLYPNPAREWVHLSAALEEADDRVNIQIVSASGVLVRAQTQPIARPIWVGDLPKGLYLLRVSTSEGDEYVHRLVLSAP